MKTKETLTGKMENFENFVQFEMNATELLTLRGGDGDHAGVDPDPEPIIMPEIPIL